MAAWCRKGLGGRMSLVSTTGPGGVHESLHESRRRFIVRRGVILCHRYACFAGPVRHADQLIIGRSRNGLRSTLSTELERRVKGSLVPQRRLRVGRPSSIRHRVRRPVWSGRGGQQAPRR